MASVVGDDSTNPASPNPDDNEGHKEASGKKKKNRCLSCKKKVGLTGNEMQTLVGFGVRSALSELFFVFIPLPFTEFSNIFFKNFVNHILLWNSSFDNKIYLNLPCF